VDDRAAKEFECLVDVMCEEVRRSGSGGLERRPRDGGAKRR
jgi:hypothetical protein